MKFTKSSVLLTVALFCGTFVFAQEPGALDQQRIGAIYHGPKGMVIVYMHDSSGRSATTLGYWPDRATLLTSKYFEEYQKELDLSEKQHAELVESLRPQIDEFRAAMNRGFETVEEHAAVISKFRSTSLASIKTTLVPSQIKNLDELENRMSILFQGLPVLAGDQFQNLDLTNEQREKLAEEQKRLSAEFERRVREMREELYRKGCEELLDESQLKTLDALTGGQWGKKKE